MKNIPANNLNCCEDVIKCVFELNESDIQTYKKLKKTGKTRADDLAEIIGKDRSTVYRSLQKLTCCGVCSKHTKKIDKGGYYHIYHCNDLKETKQKLEKHIDSWYNQMKQTLKNLDKIK